MEEELVLIVSKDHPLAGHKEIDLIETKPYPYIVYGEKSGLYNPIQDFFNKSGFKPSVRCNIEEDHTIFGFVENNYGIAIVPKLRTISSFNIVAITIKKPVVKRTIYLATNIHRRLAPAPQKFLDFILEHYVNPFLEA
jgi:DNA-binding transcriptional LysR family regulator